MWRTLLCPPTPEGPYRLGRGEVARSRVPYRDQAFVWFERAVAASLSRVNHVAFSQPFGGGERRSLGAPSKWSMLNCLRVKPAYNRRRYDDGAQKSFSGVFVVNRET